MFKIQLAAMLIQSLTSSAIGAVIQKLIGIDWASSCSMSGSGNEWGMYRNLIKCRTGTGGVFKRLDQAIISDVACALSNNTMRKSRQYLSHLNLNERSVAAIQFLIQEISRSSLLKKVNQENCHCESVTGI